MFSKTRKIKKSSDVKLKVKKFYRPQNTHQDQKTVYQSNLNLLYWSEDGELYIRAGCFLSIRMWAVAPVVLIFATKIILVCLQNFLKQNFWRAVLLGLPPTSSTDLLYPRSNYFFFLNAPCLRWKFLMAVYFCIFTYNNARCKLFLKRSF